MNNKTIRIYRPLVFLCGPYYNKGNPFDRRKILFDYIRGKRETIVFDKKNKVPFSLVPVIVDEIFSDKDLINKLGLNSKELEEIVANISYRTYIFLDSMSTSFEYGLFGNSLSKNTIYIFLESKYEKRKQREIGEYLRNSFNKNNLILYEFDDLNSDYANNEWINFPLDNNGNTIIPGAIIDRIKSDFNSLKSRAFDGDELHFIEESSIENNRNGILYKIDKDYKEVSFLISPRFSFYLSIMALSNPSIKKMIESNDFQTGYRLFKQFVFDLFIESNLDNSNINVAALLTSKPRIVFKIGKYENDYEFFKHIVFINSKITSLLDKPINKSINSIRSNREIKPSFKNTNGFNFMNSLFGIDHKDTFLINDYCKNPDKYIDSRIIKVSGKKRKIIQYKDNHCGRHLMRLHKRIANTLAIFYTPSPHSFAYKKQSNIKKCVSCHLNSNHFIKLDVSSFFNSIHEGNLFSAFFKRINRTIDKHYSRLLPNHSDIKDVLKCCFYRGYLPLGFITSPVLSDIYLNEFDNRIGNMYQSIVYTRYADDILISSKRKTAHLNKCEKEITNELSRIGLKINAKKRVKISLKNNGDSIRFVGINIVKREVNNELTISKSDIIDYAYKIHKERHKKKPDNSVIKGIIQYVSSVSSNSYNRLRKTYLAMFKENL